MQQPVPQDQAMSNQQQQQLAQQQMVLCPVRVVYETQILMPPGEQMTPNQTYFVNPQNQPPWVNQNAMYPQNQVVYVQPAPSNNIQPSAQPTMDQTQIQYIQQAYPTMQQIVANQNMLAQNMQDRQMMRPVQYANMNLMGVNQYGQVINMQQMANIGHNMSNIIQSPNMNQNIQIIQNPPNQNSPKPPDIQQNVNFIRHPFHQTDQGVVRPNMPQQTMMIRNAQPIGSQIQIQQSGNQIKQNPSMQPNITINPVQMQSNANQNMQQRQNVGVQSNKPSSYVQTQTSTGTNSNQKHNISLQPHMTGGSMQIIPSSNQNLQQRQNTNLQLSTQANHTQLQSNQVQNIHQKTNMQASASNSNQNQLYQQKQIYSQTPIVNNQGPMRITQFTQQTQSHPQPNRQGVQNNVTQTYSPAANQNMNQQTMTQRQNVTSTNTQTVQKTSQQQPRTMVRQPLPMEVSNVYNFIPSTSNVMTVTNQTRAPSNAKVGIPQQSTQTSYSSKPTMPQNIVPQIRPRPVPNHATPVKVAPSHQQVRNIPQLRPMGPSPSLMQIHNMTTSPNINTVTPRMMANNQISAVKTVTTASVSTETVGVKVNPETAENRKRKSESPDEFRNKVSVNTASQVTFNKSTESVKQNETKATVTEVGTNTLPGSSKISKQLPVPQINAQTYVRQLIESTTETRSTDVDMKTVASNEKVNPEKLVRNTVFAQARTRKISNSSNENKNMETLINKDNIISESKEKIKTPEEMKMEVTESETTVKKQQKEETSDKKNENIMKTAVNSKVKTETNVKIEDSASKSVKFEPNAKVESKTEVAPDKSDEEKIQRITDFIGKEIELSHGNIRKRDGNEGNYILTHVLDGIVIQESNIAFPIRLPLKEKILPNTPVVKPDAAKTEIKQEDDVKTESKSNDNNILTISQLNLENSQKEPVNAETEEQTEDDNNPLKNSTPETIKTWTAEELATLLTKRGWHETANILQENEIDGEALFLVSNAQLIDIGVNESHALLLSSLVKNVK